MAKLVAPLLSMDARGKVGDAIVFSGWKGIQYARKFFIPANPNTAPQIKVRNRFIKAGPAWVALSTGNKNLWNAEAVGIAQTGTSLFIKGYVEYMRDNAEVEPTAPFLPA